MSKKENKLRVYEYAKSLNMSSKEIITILKRVNIPVNNHMSVMEPEMVAKVEQFFRDIKAGAEGKKTVERERDNDTNKSEEVNQKPKSPRSSKSTEDKKDQSEDRQASHARSQKQGQQKQSPRQEQKQTAAPNRQQDAKANVTSKRASDDDAATKGKTTKKTKSNPKRFDDHKHSASRGGNRRNRHGKGKQQHAKVEKSTTHQRKLSFEAQ